MTSSLLALLNGTPVGIVNLKGGRLSFTYDEAWRQLRDAYPLSLSMPLALSTHAHGRIEAFLWGLLPDNDRVLEAWGKRFQVSPKNVFRLIEHVGEDCAGAVQFVRPERIEALTQVEASNGVQWLSEGDIEERLKTLRLDHSQWRSPQDTGQFSLAGAQPKTALLFDGARWGVPAGRTPTTHILKPPTGHWNGHAENEHFCLLLARRLGLTVPRSTVQHFGDEVAIVLERYDRLRVEKQWIRIHQEDLCQAMGIHPAGKYESEGGPGARSIAELLKEHSSAPDSDLRAFVEAMIFNWLIAGTDAHAKNYSLLLGSGGIVRLAPLYDIASILPYQNIKLGSAKLAMRIGGEYRIRNIQWRHWVSFAAELRLDVDWMRQRMLKMAEMLPDHVKDLGSELASKGLAHPVIESLVSSLSGRADACLRMIQSA